MEVIMNKIKSEKYLHRDIWINRSYDNNISDIIPFYNIHLKSIADEIKVEGAAAPCSPPNQPMDKSWKKTKVI